jgi:hypothetical protein
MRRSPVLLVPMMLTMAGAMSVSAAAQSPTAQAPMGREALAACVAIQDPTARLACFDRTVPGFLAAPVPAPNASTTPVAPARPLPTALERFGAERIPDDSPAKAAVSGPEGLDAITAKVTAVRESSSGRLSLTLDNGQVWTQSEAKALRVKAGDRVTIETGLFGSYNLSITGRNGLFKVNRLR